MRQTLMLGNGRVYYNDSYKRDHKTGETVQPRLATPYCVDFVVLDADSKQFVEFKAIYDLSGEAGAKLEKRISHYDLPYGGFVQAPDRTLEWL